MEKSLETYVPATEIPAAPEVQKSIGVPDLPQELPAVLRLVQDFVQEPLDPWSLNSEATAARIVSHE